MIFLFTDFGYNGSYVGQMKAVLADQVGNNSNVDLMHDAPMFNPKASAYLLASLIPYLCEQSVILGVVDPGVGSFNRRPVIINADNRWYVGPDNGLFNTIIKNSSEVQIWEIIWQPENLSNSFHGRDLFAPVAAMLANGNLPEVKELTVEDVVSIDWPEQLAEIIYVDNYGNAMTGLLGGELDDNVIVNVTGHQFKYARTFSEVTKGVGFWYVNSNGLIEIAVNQRSAADEFGLTIGNVVDIV